MVCFHFSFFDCLNVRSTTEHTRKRNDFLAPYTNAEDSRFDWLQNTFIAYLDAWYKVTQERPGSFNGDARARMFISQQTYRGLKITVNSTVEVVQFLLSEGMEYSWKNTLVVREKEVASMIIQHCKLLVTMISPLQCNGILHLLSREMLLVDTRESAPSGMLCLKNHCQSERNQKKNKSTPCYQQLQ